MDGRIFHLTEKLSLDLKYDWSVESMAAAARVSVPHFQRLFRAEIGVSPFAYLTQLRLEKAHKILSDPISFQLVKEVAAECGLMDESNFTREFKKRYGVTPTELRKQTWAIHQTNSPTECE